MDRVLTISLPLLACLKLTLLIFLLELQQQICLLGREFDGYSSSSAHILGPSEYMILVRWRSKVWRGSEVVWCGVVGKWCAGVRIVLTDNTRTNRYEWEIFKNLNRFMSALFIIVVMEIMEMNGFFLKYVLWIPPPNPLNSYRLLILWLLSLPGLQFSLSLSLSLSHTHTY